MKKILILAITLMGLTACHDHESQVGDFHYDVIEIDGCEYIKACNGYDGYLSHKGDCKNPIHQYNQIYYEN